MRVYFFIFPYMFSAIALWMVAWITPASSSKKQGGKGRALLMGHSVLRITYSFPQWMV
jgi:hypothetical protein